MLKKFRTYQIAKVYHGLCLKQRVPYFLRDQLYRASSSVALNLAEGSGKNTAKEQKRYYSIALGSLRECQAIFDISEIQNNEIKSIGEKLEAHLYVLATKPSD